MRVFLEVMARIFQHQRLCVGKCLQLQIIQNVGREQVTRGGSFGMPVDFPTNVQLYHADRPKVVEPQLGCDVQAGETNPIQDAPLYLGVRAGRLGPNSCPNLTHPSHPP